MNYFIIIFLIIFKIKMELFEFANVIPIVNRFKRVLKQKKVKQIDFAKHSLKITSNVF